MPLVRPLLLALLLTAPAVAQYQITGAVGSGGFTSAAGGGYQVSAVVSGPAFVTATGGGYALCSGVWCAPDEIVTASVVVDGVRGYRFYGPPAAGMTVDELAAQNLVRGVPGYYPGAPPNLWTRYDAGTDTWAPSEGTGEVLALGRAFRWLLYDKVAGNPEISASVELPFTLSTARPPNTGNVAVEFDTSGTRFNYLANPFSEDLDLTGIYSWRGGNNVSQRAPVWVWDPVARAWDDAPASIGPWEAFRIKARGPRIPTRERGRGIQIPASAAGPAAIAAAAKRAAEAPAARAPQLAFELRGADVDGRPLADRAFTVAFLDGTRPSLDDDDDAKLQPPASAYALVGSRVGGQLVGFDARPFAPAEVSLAVETRGAARSLTLSWDASALPPGQPVVLIDLETGVEVDVRSASSYAFEAVGGPSLTEAEVSGLREYADGAAAADRFVLRIGDRLPEAEVVRELALAVPAPNPTAGTARVAFALPEAGAVRVSVYDVRGREVAVLADRPFEAGRHEAVLDASRLAAGVYVVRLAAAGRVLTQRATVVR